MAAIDLRKDAFDVQEMLADAVGRYIAKHHATGTADEYAPVTRIDLIFSLADSVATPWVCLHFDTKPGSEPDGDPTHPDFAILMRENWLPAVQAAGRDDEEVTVQKQNGERRRCTYAELAETIGMFLVEMLLEARTNGVFADLPRGERCELGVDDPTTGDFGWPPYVDRGKENLV